MQKQGWFVADAACLKGVQSGLEQNVNENFSRVIVSRLCSCMYSHYCMLPFVAKSRPNGIVNIHGKEDLDRLRMHGSTGTEFSRSKTYRFEFGRS